MSFSQLAARRRFLTESLVGAATFWFPSRFFQSGETRADERRASDARPVWRENATVRSEYLEEQEVVRLVFSSATCPGGVRDYRVELEWKFLDHWEPLTSLSFPVRDVLRKSSETMTVDLDSLPRYVRYRAKIAALSSRGAESEKKLETEFVTKRPAPPVPRLGS